MTTWRKGPPPSIGWWPASVRRNVGTLRWWDGKAWSLECWNGLTAEWAGHRAKCPSPAQKAIEWTDRPAWWPERSKT